MVKRTFPETTHCLPLPSGLVDTATPELVRRAQSRGAVGWGAGLTALLLIIAGVGCTQSLSQRSTDAGIAGDATGGDPFAACTDPQRCCPLEELRCEGDGPDGLIFCTCDGLWDCSVNPNKCEAEQPIPGGGTWDCYWTEFQYSCTQGGTEANPPPGGGRWTCVWSGSESLWRCNRNETPNPSNLPQGAGAWRCEVDAENGRLVCERKEGSTPPPTGGGEWDCVERDGHQECTRKDDNGGLPPGGGTWRCSRIDVGGQLAWVCHAEVPKGDTPPGGGGWNCERISGDAEMDIYRCVKPEGSGDTPPGGGNWACSRGTEFNGTRCVEVKDKPVPVPKPGDVCVPGTRMWCDGLQYCGWGQVTCKPDGSWPTTTVSGRTVVDCQELASGERPNTTCACYHFYFNAACCERQDCLVEPSAKGQLCPKSAGALCDYCNPQKPECKGAGAYCLVTNSMETFCGQACAGPSDCPANYKCVEVKDRSEKQCIPSDFSCYH